jgi:replicative DNA helicase
VSKEELPQGVVKLAPIVALDALDLAIELSTDKRKELSDSRKSE